MKNNMISEMFGEMNAWGKMWLRVGLVTLVCAAAMSFSFGIEISWKHALFLACLTVIAAFLPEAAYTQWQAGKRSVAVVLAVVSIPTLMIEFYTHAGYSAGLRGSNIETAMVQNTKYDARQESVKESKTDLGMWSKRLADLEAQNGWAATVTAEALRAQLASANLAIDLEAKRGGCKTLCLARTKERDDIASKIAIAEERSELTRKIEATRRVVDGAREVAAKTEHKSSAVEHQNKFLAKSIAMVSAGTLTPTEFMSEGSQQTVNLAMALAGTGLPALALFIAGLYRKRDDTEHQHIANEPQAPLQRPNAAPVNRNTPVRYEARLNPLTVAQARLERLAAA